MEEFNSWIYQGGLLEMKTKGRRFTWCNGQRGLAKSWAKLDRVFLNATLISRFANAVCSYLPRSTSDHCSMHIELTKDLFSYGPSPFGSSRCGLIILNLWLVFKELGWYQLKVALRQCNKGVFGRTMAKIDQLGEKVERLESRLIQGWDKDVDRELQLAAAELSSWRLREDTRLAQMTKLKWNVDGDQNSSFFHACLSNKRRKSISDMKVADRVVFYSPKAIHQGVVDYFSGFFQKDPSRDLLDLSYLISLVISDEENARICCTPTMDEVYAAISSIPTNSSPGPDGFGSSRAAGS
ncbi:uncharacterized protein LOC121236591 [Juglans microcarpa x Juglans regia]|uniref:uncharacterized protein LOC121236591 n=1 Tax=Juglans microcarpa x Juglans regia TaxID=2249226 RepID=UPI001B7D9DE1|nr:uncharacterized protein LOC121236591 [Juglans microcarpa x Juglans regia]